MTSLASNASVLLLPGDGIGPEGMAEAERVLGAVATKVGLSLTVDHDLVGGASFDAYGTPLTQAALEKAKDADAVILGAVGGPKWDGVERHLRPEAGLLNLRQGMQVFANLRPAQCRAALASASSLKEELVSGLDILIVRELTGGVYFGEPRGIETLADGSRKAVDTQVYSESEIKRVIEVAFEAARVRDKRLCSVEKANVMETGVLWRQIANEMAPDNRDVVLSHMYADNCAMQLLRAPKQFDVIVTDNLFGDLLSDAAAMLSGSLGMLPSASLGAAVDGKSKGLYEPVHGSAPDIAGEGKANPLATILSAAMACRYSLGRPDMADMIEAAVDGALNSGARTADIAQSGDTVISTSEMGDAVLAQL